MNHYVSVRFGSGKEFEFRFKEGDTGSVGRDDAVHWIDREFTKAGCEIANPVGKVVLADKVLGLAKAYGPGAFDKKTEWVEKFTRCVGVALGKASITIDVPGNSVGF